MNSQTSKTETWSYTSMHIRSCNSNRFFRNMFFFILSQNCHSYGSILIVCDAKSLACLESFSCKFNCVMIEIFVPVSPVFNFSKLSYWGIRDLSAEQLWSKFSPTEFRACPMFFCFSVAYISLIFMKLGTLKN